jgi:uncharacterized protein
MKIVPDPLTFDWDSGNSNKNFLKHKVTVQEAEEVFVNEPLVIVEDPVHSKKEKRFNGLGKTIDQRRLFLTFTIRNNKVRIISVRDMDRKEKYEYEKTKANS